MENKDMPAFPVLEAKQLGGQMVLDLVSPGLSKREYFAGVAMQGLLSHPDIYDDTTPLEVVARDAVAQADVLLLELSKPQT